MKLGFYFNSEHLKPWTWKDFMEDNLPLSGTDSQFLRILYSLAKRNHDCFLFSTRKVNSEDYSIFEIYVENLSDAVLKSKEIGIDILIFSTSCGFSQIYEALPFWETLRQPCLVWCQNFLNGNPILDVLAKSSFVRRFTCVSSCQVDALRDHSIFFKTNYIHNSIDLDRFEQFTHVEREPLNICYLGSLTIYKGFQHLARIWPYIHKKFPKSKLFVLGSSKLYDKDSNLGPLGVTDRDFENSAIIPYLGKNLSEVESKGVFFLGLVTPDKIRQVVSSCSVGIINPSLKTPECCSVSSLEIQACGVPVIGGNCGGNRETIKHQQTGILVRNERDLLLAISKLLDDPLSARTMGQAGYQWIGQNFSETLIVDQWCNVLESAISHRSLTPKEISWKDDSPSILVRELIRVTKSLPLVGNRVPTLDETRNVVSNFIRKILK